VKHLLVLLPELRIVSSCWCRAVCRMKRHPVFGGIRHRRCSEASGLRKSMCRHCPYTPRGLHLHKRAVGWCRKRVASTDW
jgi:hypothetical protein